MKSKFLGAIAIAALTAMCMGAVVGCSGGGNGHGTVAATVDGYEIYEDDITADIEAIRANYGVTDEDSWGQLLAASGMTPESLREQAINTRADDYLIEKAAKSEFGIEVTDAEVEENIQNMRSLYSTDKDWQEALSAVGMTEDEYRDVVRQGLTQNKVQEHFEGEATASEEDMASMLSSYATYYNGAKRSSHILFDKNDKATAEEVLAKLKSGELKFEDAAKEYSKDSSAESGGDVGWDKMNSFVEPYQTALDGLNKGDMSDLVESDYGIHIIVCTDVWKAPEDPTKTKLEDMPEDWRANIEELAKSNATSTLYQDWVNNLRENANIVIRDMPDGLSYYVDMTKYQTESSGSAATVTTDGAEGATVVSVDENGNVTAENASGSSAASETSEGASSEASASSQSAQSSD